METDNSRLGRASVDRKPQRHLPHEDEVGMMPPVVLCSIGSPSPTNNSSGDWGGEERRVAMKRGRMTCVRHCQMQMLESELKRASQAESSALSQSPGGPFQCADGPGLQSQDSASPPVPAVPLSPLVPASGQCFNSWTVLWESVHHVEEIFKSDGSDCRQI